MRVRISSELIDDADAEVAAAQLRKCVHCGFCNATCPTYRLTGDELDGPRGRIYLVKQLLEGAEVSRLTQRHLDRCLTCLNCETTCPSGVAYGRLVDAGRRLTDARVGRSPFDRWRRALLRELLSARRFTAAVEVARRLRPILPRALRARLPVPPAPAPARREAPPVRRVLLLAGCVQPALLPNVGRATRRVLAAAGIEARVAAGALCCGALREHLSDHAGALAAMRRNVDVWWPALAFGEVDAIVADASACALALKGYPQALAGDPLYAERAAAVGAAACDLADLLPQLVPRLAGRLRPEARGPLAWHAPCTLQHGQRLSGVVERGLRDLGFDPRPAVREAAMCCGSAGAYSLLQPGIASALRERKLAALRETGAPQIVSANVGCILHLGAASERPVRHFIEVIDAALGPGDASTAPV
ncbi:MAG: glycolate oxidase subunit GlcF [Gammaproteobacteria bacterium]|nr:glycolate oxidase subunit GlcF [Gammaproteobacteria bacterium]